MREMLFKIEQENVVKEGDMVKVLEFKLPSSYYYMIEHAYCMSANYTTTERLKTFEAKITKLERTPQGNYATLVFDE